MDIKPIEPERINTYYLGVFDVLRNAGVKNKELYEKQQAPSGSRIEEYFPLIVHSLNNRGNWKCLTTMDAINIHHIDFCWTNATKITMKGTIHSRFLLNSINHYISNKKDFYTKFKDYDFIPKFQFFNRDTIHTDKYKIIQYFNDSPVIIKPDLGSVSTGILIQNKLDYHEVLSHISKYYYDNWTVSQITIPKLINGYVVSNRIYLLVTKDNTNLVKGYYYNEFMNYRTENVFQGNISDPLQFLTNYMDKSDPLADTKFVKTRYIPHNEYVNNFTKDQWNIITNKLHDIFNIIVDTMKDDLMSHNDNKLDNTNTGFPHMSPDNTMGFHLYGVDVLITDDLNIKVIEINGAPAVNVKTRYYQLHDRLDYFDLIEELIQKTIDNIYPPKNHQPIRNNFIPIYEGYKKHNNQILTYYIPQSITEKYPFILSALAKRSNLKRTKNLHDDIFFFYGLRERYITENTNMNYYDELLNYLTSKRTRKASIINKIQGITYYLANKWRLYQKLLLTYNSESVHQYHPVSHMLYYNNSNVLRYKLRFIINNNNNVKKWIIKPVNGSRGIGIKIFGPFRRSFFINRNKHIIDDMIRHIQFYSEKGIASIDITNNKTFDGLQIQEHKFNKYKHWIISQYIDNPDLIRINTDTIGRKYNIRFYVLVNIKQSLPVCKDVDKQCNQYDIIELYVFNDMMVYYSMLEYYESELPLKYIRLGDHKDKFFDRMKNLTNLEIVNNVYDFLNSLNDNKYYDKHKEKRLLTDLLSNVYPKQSSKFIDIMNQGKHIIYNTVNSIKYDLRPLNRHNDNYKGCYNLLAYDTLLDSDNKLWLIEINRGPDIKGLQLTIGNDKSTEFFDEIFNIVLDPHITCTSNKPKYWSKLPIKYEPIKLY
jgi:hypothetical protein